MPSTRLLLLTTAVVALATSALAAPADGCRALSARDAAAIRATIEKYRTSWLAGDQAGVMATLSQHPVLQPPGNAPAVVGREAILRFWWPGGPRTRVTLLSITVEELGGDCHIAYARGQDAVEWNNEGTASTHANFGAYLNILQKTADGAWRISHHMWDDDLARRR